MNGEWKTTASSTAAVSSNQAECKNDNWTTDESTPEGALNAPFTDAVCRLELTRSGITVDKQQGADVIISGAQFATDGYRVGGEAITTDTLATLIRVGDGTVDGANSPPLSTAMIQYRRT